MSWPEFGFLIVQSFIFAALTITVVHLAVFIWKEVLKR